MQVPLTITDSFCKLSLRCVLCSIAPWADFQNVMSLFLLQIHVWLENTARLFTAAGFDHFYLLFIFPYRLLIFFHIKYFNFTLRGPCFTLHILCSNLSVCWILPKSISSTNHCCFFLCFPHIIQDLIARNICKPHSLNILSSTNSDTVSSVYMSAVHRDDVCHFIFQYSSSLSLLISSIWSCVSVMTFL